jgi:hypothetical protein
MIVLLMIVLLAKREDCASGVDSRTPDPMDEAVEFGSDADSGAES